MQITYGSEDRVKERIDRLAQKIQNRVYSSRADIYQLRQVRKALRVALDTLKSGNGGGSTTPQYCAVMFEHPSFSGRALSMQPGEAIYNFADLYAWNDVVSSVKVTPGCRLTTYQHSRYRGWSQAFRSNAANVGGYNDQFSSALCECGF